MLIQLFHFLTLFRVMTNHFHIVKTKKIKKRMLKKNLEIYKEKEKL